jgi:hypothetical protein
MQSWKFRPKEGQIGNAATCSIRKSPLCGSPHVAARKQEGDKTNSGRLTRVALSACGTE